MTVSNQVKIAKDLNRRVRELRLHAQALAAAGRSALVELIRLEGLRLRGEWPSDDRDELEAEVRICRLEAEVLQRDSAARYRQARLLLVID